MGKSSTPPPPDYKAAAKETAEGNLEAARSATYANRINQVTPYGSLRYSQKPEEIIDYAAYNKALDKFNEQKNRPPADSGGVFSGFGFDSTNTLEPLPALVRPELNLILDGRRRLSLHQKRSRRLMFRWL
jgi:hypothetical protein